MDKKWSIQSFWKKAAHFIFDCSCRPLFRFFYNFAHSRLGYFSFHVKSFPVITKNLLLCEDEHVNWDFKLMIIANTKVICLRKYSKCVLTLVPYCSILLEDSLYNLRPNRRFLNFKHLLHEMRICEIKHPLKSWNLTSLSSPLSFCTFFGILMSTLNVTNDVVRFFLSFSWRVNKVINCNDMSWEKLYQMKFIGDLEMMKI